MEESVPSKPKKKRATSIKDLEEPFSTKPSKDPVQTLVSLSPGWVNQPQNQDIPSCTFLNVLILRLVSLSNEASQNSNNQPRGPRRVIEDSKTWNKAAGGALLSGPPT